jgi:hypothetical protein
LTVDRQGAGRQALEVERNLLWNAGQFRRQFFDLNDLLKPMTKLASFSDVNTTFKRAPPERASHRICHPLHGLQLLVRTWSGEAFNIEEARN